MRINIYSGARRLALLVAILASLVALGATAFNEPDIPLNYSIASPNAPFVRTHEECPEKGATHYISVSAHQGKTVSVYLCLLPDMGLIPYKIGSRGGKWLAEKDSSEVSAYKKELEQRFSLSPSDLDAIESERSTKYWEQWRATLLYLAVGLAVFWLLITAIGWVVRGFTGIPFGQDTQPATSDGDEP